MWLEIKAGMALRLGDLTSAEAVFPELERSALESGEPHRILPMAGVVLPWAAHLGDHATAAEVVDAVLDLPARTSWALLAPATIPRALAQLGDVERLARFDGRLDDGTSAAFLRATKCACRGFLALADDDWSTAVEAFREEVEVERRRGAGYLAACAELDLAVALDAGGDAEAAVTARSGARAVIDALGCINPF